MTARPPVAARSTSEKHNRDGTAKLKDKVSNATRCEARVKVSEVRLGLARSRRVGLGAGLSAGPVNWRLRRSRPNTLSAGLEALPSKIEKPAMRRALLPALLLVIPFLLEHPRFWAAFQLVGAS